MKSFLTFIFGLSTFVSLAQIDLSEGTPTATENFDGMGNTLNLPSNWRIRQSSSTPTWAAGVLVTTQQASTGSPTTGGTYNFGSSTTERAVGAMTSGSFASPNSVMVELRNNNPVNKQIVALDISYSAERYRINSAASSIQFFYSLNGTTWISSSAGDIAPAEFPTGTSSYTFASPLTISKTINISSIGIPQNTNFYLRWNINTTGSNSQGIAIDDISITASFGPLPVKFGDISVESKERSNAIIFSTYSEKNNDYFELERSSNGQTFEPMSKIQSFGDSDEMKSYQFIDESPLSSVNYYRIKQVDLDGQSTYSNIVSTKSKANISISVSNDAINLESDAPVVDVMIMNASGLLIRKINQVPPQSIYIGDLVAGIYIINVQVNGETYSQKVTKQ